MSFQTRKTFVHLRNTKEDIFAEIQTQCKWNIPRTRKVVDILLSWMVLDSHTEEKNGCFLCTKNYYCSFVKLRLNHWCHMDYFNNVVTTFLGLGTFQLHYCLCKGEKAVGFHQKYLKGIVHLKMKILSSFTHPQVVPNLYECLLCWTQRKIFWRMWKTEQFWGTIDFHSIFFLLWKSMVKTVKTAWLQTFFKISSFVFGRTKKFIQVWNYLRVSN